MPPNLLSVLLLLLIINIAAANKIIHLEITPDLHHLVLYTSGSDHVPIKVNFKIDFNTTEMSISKELSDSQLFMDKFLRKKINTETKIHVKNFHKQADQQGKNGQEEDFQGIVGFKENSDFFHAIKKSLDIEHFKLWFKISQHKIEIIPEKCANSIFLPLQIQVQSPKHSEQISIEHFSLNFQAKSHKFINLIGKKSNPFTINPQEMRAKVNLQLLNEVRTLSLKNLLGKNCNKISGSNNFECDIDRNKNTKKDDLGILLFEFDPIICPDHLAIELLQEGKIDSQGYYWSHVMLITINFALVIVFKYRFEAVNRIILLLSRQKYSRIN